MYKIVYVYRKVVLILYIYIYIYHIIVYTICIYHIYIDMHIYTYMYIYSGIPTYIIGPYMYRLQERRSHSDSCRTVVWPSLRAFGTAFQKLHEY